MSVAPSLLDAFRETIEPLPDRDGGRAVIAVTDSTPPAIAMLATGSVYCRDATIRLAVDAASSVATSAAGSATLLTGDDRGVLRTSIAPLQREVFGSVAVLGGPVVAIRRSAELPWSLQLSFVPSGTGDVEVFLAYWRRCRAWLADPAADPPPERPH